jgi:hypothetical protein
MWLRLLNLLQELKFKWVELRFRLKTMKKPKLTARNSVSSEWLIKKDTHNGIRD